METAHVPEELRERWDRFAAEDAMYFITGWDRDWTVDTFLESGREIIGWLHPWIDEVVEPGRMLEIGCGLGRTAINWAAHFREVEAVDISRTMVERAQELAPPENLRFSVVPGDGTVGFGDGEFDFCFTYAVFQHVRDERVIATYVREIGRVLRPGGHAVVQLDTRPGGLAAWAYERAPDFLLSRARRRGMRRYRRDPAWLASLFEASGLAIVDEKGARTDKHFFLLEKR